MINELPQNVLGWILSRLWKNRLQTISNEEIKWVQDYEHKNKYKIYVVTDKSKRNDDILKYLSGCSLGKYICLTDLHDLTTLKHEGGHCIQSQKLGWFYLPVIGIYSAVFCNLWDRVFHQKWMYSERVKWYYSRWTEKWADELGGVERKFN